MPALITEVVSQQPTIVVVGTNPTLIHQLSNQHISGAQFVVLDYASLTKEQLATAYRIVLVLSPGEVLPAKLLATLRSAQDKLVVVLPIISAPQGKEPYLNDWNTYVSTQRAHILELNSIFSHARFFFCLNLIHESPILELITPHRVKDSLHTFDVTLPLTTLRECLSAVAQKLSIPGKTSVLFCGEDYALVDAVKRATAHQQLPTSITPIPLSLTSPLPFSVGDTQIVESHSQTIDAALLEKTLQKEQYEDERALLPNPSKPQSTPKKTAQQPTTYEFVEQALTQSTKPVRQKQKINRVTRKAMTEKKVVRKSKRKTAVFYIGVLFSGVALGLLVLFGVYMWSSAVFTTTLQQTVVSLAADEREKHIATLQRQARFIAVQNSLYVQVLDFDRLFIDQQRLALAENIVQAVTDYEVPTQTLQKLSESVLNTDTQNVETTANLTNLATLELQNQYQQLSQLTSAIDGTELNVTTADVQSGLEATLTTLDEKRKNILTLQKILPHTTQLLGVEGKKTYAVLLQNSQELRPTGGFIQSVGIVSFDQGVLTNVDVYSVYDLDRRLVGAAIPPDEVRQYLGESQWFLRDSNWDPHAPASMQRVEWFITNSLGVQVDGVIGMTSYGLQTMLQAFETVPIPELNEVVTHKNVQDRLEFYSDAGAQQGSETDFSTLLLSSFMAQLQQLEGDGLKSFFRLMNQSLLENQLFITTLRDDESSVAFSQLRWDGGVVSPDCPSQLIVGVGDCQIDTVYEVEANVGINKANAYINKNIAHSVVLQESAAVHRRVSTYSNSARTRAWPKGDYKSFVRYYIPESARNIAVYVDDVQLPANQITLSVENDKVVVGVYFEVAIESDVAVTITYSTPLSNTLSSYAFFNQKQYGTQLTPLVVTLELANNTTPTLIAPKATLSNGSSNITFEHFDEVSGLFGVSFE